MFCGKPRAACRQSRTCDDENRVVLQGERKISVQQSKQCSRRAAAGTVQSGQLVKHANRIKTVRGGIEEKDDGSGTDNCHSENDARKNRQRRLCASFYFWRNSL